MKQNLLKISYINVFVGLMIIMVGFLAIEQFINDTPTENSEIHLLLIAGGMGFGGFIMGKYGIAIIQYRKQGKHEKWR